MCTRPEKFSYIVNGLLLLIFAITNAQFTTQLYQLAISSNNNVCIYTLVRDGHHTSHPHIHLVLNTIVYETFTLHTDPDHIAYAGLLNFTDISDGTMLDIKNVTFDSREDTTKRKRMFGGIVIWKTINNKGRNEPIVQKDCSNALDHIYYNCSFHGSIIKTIAKISIYPLYNKKLTPRYTNNLLSDYYYQDTFTTTYKDTIKLTINEISENQFAIMSIAGYNINEYHIKNQYIDRCRFIMNFVDNGCP